MAKQSRAAYLQNAGRTSTEALATLASGKNPDGTDFALDTTGTAALATVTTGEFQGSTSAGVMPTITASYVRIKARSDNVGSVYIGPTGVTKPDGTTDTATGFELGPGEETGWMPTSNLNKFFRICDNAGDDVTYMVLV